MTIRLLVLVMPRRLLVSIPVSDFYDCLITNAIPHCQDMLLQNPTGSSVSITTSYVSIVWILNSFLHSTVLAEIVQITALIFPFKTHIFSLCTMKKKSLIELFSFC